jgi:hypothetical protein
MIIIGEKINGSIPSTAKAITERDGLFGTRKALALFMPTYRICAPPHKNIKVSLRKCFFSAKKSSALRISVRNSPSRNSGG